MSPRLKVALAALAFACVLPASGLTLKSEGNRIMNCEMGAASFVDEKCDLIGYAIRIAIWAAPALIITLCVIAGGIAFCCCRLCCNCCCGFSEPTSGFCCEGSAGKDPDYSGCDYFRAKMWTVFFLLLALFGGIFSYFGASVLLEGVTDFTSAAGGMGRAVNGTMDNINASMIVDRYWVDNDTYSKQNLFEGSNLDTSGRALAGTLHSLFNSGTVDTFKLILGYISYGLLAIAVLPFIFMFVGFLSACCGKRTCWPHSMAVLLLSFGSLIWLLHTLFAVMQLFVTDACTEFDGVVSKQRSLAPMLMFCSEDLFADFTTTFQGSMDEQTINACQGVVNTCYMAALTWQANVFLNRTNSCPAHINDPTDCTEALGLGELLEAAQTTIRTHPTLVAQGTLAVGAGAMCDHNSNRGCSLVECSEHCKLGDGRQSTIGRVALKVRKDIEAANAVGNSMDVLGATLSSCNFALNVLVGAFINPCENMMAGVDQLWIGTGILGIVVVGGTFALAMGSKRFERFVPQQQDGGAA